MADAVFAYGSLVSPASFAETLGRDPGSMIPALLSGWRRSWTVVRDNRANEKTFADAAGRIPSFIVGLNIEPDAGRRSTRPNGALIEVDADELQRLDLREMRYDRVEVTGAVSSSFERVFAYTAKPHHYSPEPPAGAVAMAPYLRAVETAYRALGAGEWEHFLASTGPPPVELIEPRLVRDEIPPGNPRGW